MRSDVHQSPAIRAGDIEAVFLTFADDYHVRGENIGQVKQHSFPRQSRYFFLAIKVRCPEFLPRESLERVDDFAVLIDVIVYSFRLVLLDGKISGAPANLAMFSYADAVLHFEISFSKATMPPFLWHP